MAAFSDGVLAIVVTILVLEIKIPQEHHFSNEGLISFLGKAEHDVLMYFVSFWLVGIYWLLHHEIVAMLRYVNARLLLTNLAFLFAITLLPFIADLKNSYPDDPVAAMGLGCGHLLIGATLLLLCRAAVANPDMLREPAAQAIVRRLIISVSIGCALAILASAASFIDPVLSARLLPLVPLAYTIALFRHPKQPEV
jgi:uncharacterized membrane protein